MLPYRRIAATASAFLRTEDGPTATEYAIMLALIVFVAMATIGAIGGQMQVIYDNINAAVPG